MNPNMGDLVWAQMAKFPPWPGRVVKPHPNMKKPNKKEECSWIYFFGSNNYSWIENSQIKPYKEFKNEYSNMCKTKLFKKSMQEIDEFINKTENDPTFESVFDKLLEKDEEERQKKIAEKKNKDFTPKTKKSSDAATPTPTPTPTKRGITPTKRAITPTKRASTELRNSQSSRASKKIRSDSTTPKIDENGTDEKVFDEEIPYLSPLLSKPISPKVDFSKISEDMKNKKFEQPRWTIGFMGIGNMGSSIVKNFIASDHKVNIWNRSGGRCEKFKEQADMVYPGLVQIYEAPCDVVSKSDITFSCLASPRAAKEVVFNNCGVTYKIDGKDSLHGKSYVELTSIDPDTSKDICNVIQTNGGRYLEAQIQGSKRQAEEGKLIIVAAGDETLFNDCQTCFKAIARKSYYLGPVGTATTMNLCVNMSLGISLAGFAESMILAERCGLSIKDFLEIFKLSNAASDYIIRKGDYMVERDFSKVEQALEYMQKDLKLCLDISNEIKQNLPVTAATNEVYKTARRSGYDGLDLAVIFMKMRH